MDLESFSHQKHSNTDLAVLCKELYLRNAASKIVGLQAGKDLLESTLALIHHLTHYHSSQSATAGCLNHPLASLHPTSSFSIPSSLSYSFSSPLWHLPFPPFSPPFYTLSHLLLFALSSFSSFPSLLDLCSILFAILLVPVVKEVWLPTVCCHSFFQTRIRHPGIGCMLSYWGTGLLPSPWLSLLPLPSSFSVNQEASVHLKSRFWLSNRSVLPALHYRSVAH